MAEWVEAREQGLSPSPGACAYSRGRGDKFGWEGKGRGGDCETGQTDSGRLGSFLGTVSALLWRVF